MSDIVSRCMLECVQQRPQLTCNQDNKFECREFADKDGVEAHGNQSNGYRYECRMPSQDTHTRIDQYDQTLDLQGCCV